MTDSLNQLRAAENYVKKCGIFFTDVSSICARLGPCTRQELSTKEKINKWTSSNSPGKYWGVETFVHNKYMYKLICRRDDMNHHTL